MLKNIKKRKIVIGVVTVGLLLIGLYYYGDYKRTHTLITNDQGLQSFMMNMKEGDVAKYKAYKAKMYAQDKYGGDTPEETLRLFVEALKNKNIKLASKYFVIEKQSEMYKKLPQAFKSGGVDSLIDFYDNGKIKSTYIDYSNQYELILIKNKSEANFIFRFILNKQTNKWKMISI